MFWGHARDEIRDAPAEAVERCGQSGGGGGVGIAVLRNEDVRDVGEGAAPAADQVPVPVVLGLMRTLGRVDEAGVAALAGVDRRRDALEGLVPDRAVVPARLPGVIDGDEARVVWVARPRPPAVKREEPGVERAGACGGQRAI